MAGVRVRGEEIRSFILDNVEQHAADIARITAERFGITRQAVHKHLQRLVDEGALGAAGRTQNRTYRPAAAEWRRRYRLSPALAEDVVWRNDVRLALAALPPNALSIWQYCFTEMFNNAIEHSGGAEVQVAIVVRSSETTVEVADDGVGIFRKIQRELGLLDERHAVLELAKGKLTTDPERHTGEGVFFTSRALDRFEIVSGEVHFRHLSGEPEDWLLEPESAPAGTAVRMQLANRAARTLEKVFAQFASADDYGFNQTVVPVRLVRYGGEQLISRSQARRLLARVELFKTVILDFADIDSIGPAFADEVFRVFVHAHPQIAIVPAHANPAVQKMIDRARAAAATGV